LVPSRKSLILLTAVALLFCYAATLRGMWNQWMIDEDMGHGVLVPLVVAWIVWRERARWLALKPQPSPWGYLLLATGALLHVLSLAGAGLFAASLGLMISIVGAVLCIGGWPFLRLWSFPLFLALFMVPKLDIVYAQITLPLQLLASRIAAAMLSLGGVHVVLQGNILDVGGHRVAVEEACNGVRYLLLLGFTAVVFAYLVDERPWMRVALLASVAPIAILANAARVAAAAWIPRLDSGTPHTIAGVCVFIACLAAIAVARAGFSKVWEWRHA
jgi:exosortase